MKMRRCLNGFLSIKKNNFLLSRLNKRLIHDYNFDSDEEILENYLDNVMLIGMNLPDQKNLLTETAVEKLCESFNKFNTNNEMSVAILHGCGGNFCSGIVSTENAANKSKELIEVMNSVKKPIIGSLNGYATNFGFQLAIMCDLKLMEESSLIGFGRKTERTDLSPIVYQKFLLTVGLSTAMEMILTNSTRDHNGAIDAGFISSYTQCGAGLGKALLWAQSIALSPIEKMIEEKYKVLSCLLKK